MTLVVTSNVVGQTRGEPIRLPNRRRRLSTVVARHRPSAGRRFIVSVHRQGEVAYRPNDAAVRLRADWRRTLVGPNDVVLITEVPLGRGAASIGLAIAAVALIAVAGPAGAALGASVGTALSISATAGAFAVQAGLVIGGVALSYAAQASSAAKKKADGTLYSVSGGGNLPKANGRRPLLYGKSWSAPPLSQKDFFTYDGDAMVLVKRMTLGIGRFEVHRIRVGDALFWDAASGIQAPFNAVGGTQPAAIEILYETPSALAPGDVITSPDVGGQELPRVGGNPDWTPWFRATPQGVTAQTGQMSWTYPRIYRTSSAGRQVGTVAGVTFQGREIDPVTGNPVGAPFTLFESREGDTALTVTPLRRSGAFRFPNPAATYEVRAQNAYQEASGFVQENAASWDGMSAFQNDVRIRPQTTEIVIRVRAGKGLTVTAFSDVSVEATRILPVWTGQAWVEQPTRKAVWAYCDLVRAVHGLNQPEGVDLDRVAYYANAFTEFDTYDGQLPEVASFWEAAAEVLHPLRADPVKIGAVHSFVRDESRAAPRHVLTRRQIVRDSAGATYKTKVEGSDVIVEFNRDGDPKRPDEVRYAYGPPSRTPKRYKVAGIRDGAHAHKHAMWLALIAVFRGAERRITTEWDGRLVFPGDHILSDLWFFRDKRAVGVASRAGNLLQLDVAANVAPEWGYVSIRTRVGREWGILRARGVGPRGLELHAGDVAALEARTGTALGTVLASDTQDPTTVVLGDLSELQETYVARSAVPSDADHVQIEMVRDDTRIWQILGETTYEPLPVDPDGLEEPLQPTIAVLHAKCLRIETGIEVVWGVSATRGARAYEADISYDAGATWAVLSALGPASSGQAPMRQSDGPVTVRARAFGRTGLPGAYIATTFTTVAPVVDGRQTGIVNLPLIDYEGLTADIRARIDHILDVEAYAGQISAQAKADFALALGRADAVSAEAQANFAAATGRADAVRTYAEGVNATAVDALGKAVQSLSNDAANQAAIVAESSTRLTADSATTTRLDGAISRIGTAEAAQVTESTTRASADEAATKRIDGALSRLGTAEGSIVSISQTQASDKAAFASQISAINAYVFDGSNPDGLPAARASIVSEASARATADGAITTRIDALTSTVSGHTASIASESSTRATADAAQASQILDISAAVFDPNVPTGLPATRANLLSESQARATADTATATRLDGLGARVDDHSASIINEASVRSAADATYARQISDINAVLFDPTVPHGLPAARASVTAETQARVGADGALTSRLDALVTTVGGNTSAIVTEQTTRANADEAAARRLDGLSARIDDNSASIINEATVRGTTDATYARQIGDISAVLFDPSIPYGLPAASARITTEAQARADGDGALASRLTSLTAQTDSDRAYFLNEQQTRIGRDNAFATDISSLYTQTGNNASAISNQAKTITDIYTAQASTNIDLYARSDAGSAYGRFGISAVSAPSGVSVRLQALLATQSGGQTRGAGYYLDLLADGSSRFVVDANAFYITSNGQSAPAFSFDGYTLTIPSLRVTQQILLPGSASDKAVKTIENFDCGAPNDNWREVPGTQISFYVDNSPGFGVVFTVATDIYAEASGTNQVYVNGTIETAIAVNGHPYNDQATNALSIGAGGGVANNTNKRTGRIGSSGMEIFDVGQITLSLMYRFKGSPAGVKANIVYAQTKALIVKR